MIRLVKYLSEMIDDEFTPIAPIDEIQVKIERFLTQSFKVGCAGAFILGVLTLVNVVEYAITDMLH